MATTAGIVARPPPADLAVTVAPRQGQVALAQDAGDAHGGAHREEGVEHQREPRLDLPIGILDDRTGLVPLEPGRQHQRQGAALGLGQEPGGEPGAQGVQLQLGDRPLEAEEQAPVG